MGTELLEDPEIAALCTLCSAEADIDLRRLLTVAGDDELRLTENAQPALTFMAIGLTMLLARAGHVWVAAAGHSVGEYGALASAHAVEPMAVIRAVVERGKAMADAVPAGTTSMSAVLGLSPEAVEAALEGVEGAWPANYNTRTQIVIAGTMAGLEAATRRLQDAGAKRVIPLNVSAAFHTPLMAPAAERLRAALDQITWRTPLIPVMANLTGESHRDGGTMPHVLEMQLRSPVKWAGCVGALVEMGCDTFLEVGPKRALTGMMRELAPGKAAVAIGTPTAISELAIQ